MKKVDLNKKSAERLMRERPPWLYRNELPQTLFADPGETVALVHQGEFLATAFINPNSALAARIVAFEPVTIDRAFLKDRIQKALTRRRELNSNAVRLIHSEADGLPGLIADRYGNYLVLAFTSAGMERHKTEIVEIFKELLRPEGIWEKGDAVRLKEGLKISEGPLFGDLPDRFVVKEGTYRFETDLKRGQKTGFFLDQRQNRRKVGRYGGEHTLDLFANAGGFGIYAKAQKTTFVEISAAACEQIKTNCALNGLQNYTVVCEDVFDFLQKDTQSYDLIILDPPAFAKNRKARSGAMKGWKYLISQTLRRLKEGGHLAIFSCSHAIGVDDLLPLAQSSAADLGCRLQVLERLQQDEDHPWILNIPNSLYLTGAIVRRVSW